MNTETRALDAIVQRNLTLKSSIKRGNLARPGDALVRAATALVAENVLPDGGQGYLRALQGDEVTPLVLRAATTPGTLANDSWAGILAQNAVVDFLLSIGPISAASQLMARSNVFQYTPDLRGITPVGILPEAILGGFVEEGAPIPLRGWTVLGETLDPHKMAFISAITRELAKRSNAEALVRDAMEQSAALTLDAGLFSDSAASAAAPAGLLYGAIEVTASAQGGSAAMREDLAALATAVAPVAAGDIVFVAAPALAVRIALQSTSPFPYPVLPSTGLAEGTVAAIAPRALAFAVDPKPDISVSNEATLHMSDTPLQISTPGTPATVAAPVHSAFQMALVAIRLFLQVSWGKRASGAVAFVAGADWSEL